MILPDPQLGLDLRAVPEARPPVDPRTLRRVDRMLPAAPDGEEFFFSFLAAARSVSAECGGRFLPAQVRARCKTLGVKPPHPNHWGVAWGRLPRYGFRRTDDQALSHTASRNAARECVWVEVDRAAGPVEAPRE